jgi:hypothetical protein
MSEGPFSGSPLEKLGDLIIYDTKKAELLSIDEYDEASRSRAMADLRAKQEALLNKLDHVEVGLFESDSRLTLERTHSRYFKSLEELNASLREIAKKSA